MFRKKESAEKSPTASATKAFNKFTFLPTVHFNIPHKSTPESQLRQKIFLRMSLPSVPSERALDKLLNCLVDDKREQSSQLNAVKLANELFSKTGNSNLSSNLSSISTNFSC